MIQKTTILLLFQSAALCSQIPMNGLIGGWPFTGNANDMSGLGNHGTVFGATLTKDRFNQPGAAYSFNGANSSIVMMTAGPTGSVSRSVSFWARPTATNLAVGFGYGDADLNGGIFQVNFNYNCEGVGFDNSVQAVIRSGSVVNNTKWHHIVAVHDATVGIQVGNVKLYVDGVLQSNVNCSVGGTTSTISTNNTFPITVGRTANASARYFNGDLDDFYFYNRALTPAEVLQLYNYVTSSFESAADFELSVFPNPSTSIITIYSPIEIHQIEILDLVGRVCQNDRPDSKDVVVDVSSLSRGVYLLRCRSAGNVSITRIVKY
jgi:hypothetical protein